MWKSITLNEVRGFLACSRRKMALHKVRAKENEGIAKENAGKGADSGGGGMGAKFRAG
jgi:hypothetical protein